MRATMTALRRLTAACTSASGATPKTTPPPASDPAPESARKPNQRPAWPTPVGKVDLADYRPLDALAAGRMGSIGGLADRPNLVDRRTTDVVASEEGAPRRVRVMGADDSCAAGWTLDLRTRRVHIYSEHGRVAWVQMG